MSVAIENQINPALIKAFVQSTQNVLRTMVNLESKIGKPILKAKPHPSFDVSGIVGFSGEIVGSVVISLPAATAVNIVEAFTGEKMEIDSEDFADAVGELSNMIAGNAKKDFNLNAGIGIPNVIIGPGHSIARLTDVPCVIIPCSSELGDFAIEVNIKRVSTEGI